MKANMLSGAALAAAAISLALGGAVVSSTSAEAHHRAVHRHGCGAKMRHHGCKAHHHCKARHHCKHR